MDRISASKAKSQVMRVARGGKDAFCSLLEKHFSVLVCEVCRFAAGGGGRPELKVVQGQVLPSAHCSLENFCTKVIFSLGRQSSQQILFIALEFLLLDWQDASSRPKARGSFPFRCPLNSPVFLS